MHLLAQTAGQWDPVLQYGAFGLCLVLTLGFFGFCVFLLRQHRDERKDLVSALGERASESKCLHQESLRAVDNSTQALRRLSEALKDRPCLISDSRIKPT